MNSSRLREIGIKTLRLGADSTRLKEVVTLPCWWHLSLGVDFARLRKLELHHVVALKP